LSPQSRRTSHLTAQDFGDSLHIYPRHDETGSPREERPLKKSRECPTNIMGQVVVRGVSMYACIMRFRRYFGIAASINAATSRKTAVEQTSGHSLGWSYLLTRRKYTKNNTMMTSSFSFSFFFPLLPLEALNHVRN
jgi:hypothetical protein